MPQDLDIAVAIRRRAVCGEGPVWDAATNTLLWVDIVPGEILRSDLATAETTVTDYPAMVGAVAPRSAGGVVAAVTTGFVGLDGPEGNDGHDGAGTVTRRVDCLSAGIRMNDAKTDPAGRFWAGSCADDFAPGKGGLWRLDEHWNAELILPGLTQPNGMGWSLDGRTFYLVETQDRQILSFPFDPDSSTLTPEPTVIIGPERFPQYPDGLAVDSRGHLWVAEYAGSAVYEFSPAGELIRKIDMPTSQPTSCAFVGPELDRLVVTSAAYGLDAVADPDAGSIFLISGHGATGLASVPFRG